MEKKLFVELYKEKGPIIYKYLIKNGCNSETAEDIIQNSFIKAMEYMVHTRIDNIYAWIFKVSVNQYYDYCRKKSRYPEVDVNGEEFINHFISEDECDKRLLRDEFSTDVKNILNSLTDTYKNLLILKYDLELSYKEIAQVLNTSESNVKTYLLRARKRFKKVWEDEISE